MGTGCDWGRVAGSGRAGTGRIGDRSRERCREPERKPPHDPRMSNDGRRILDVKVLALPSVGSEVLEGWRVAGVSLAVEAPDREKKGRAGDARVGRVRATCIFDAGGRDEDN